VPAHFFIGNRVPVRLFILAILPNIVYTMIMTSMLTEKQEKALALFYEELPSLASDPLKKFKHVVVVESGIVGVFDDASNAAVWAVEHYPIGEFVLQEVITKEDLVEFLFSAA
jgi:hypothetical protein